MIKPPFTEETANEKVKLAQDLWNTKNPENVVKVYTQNCTWRNRNEFISGHEEIKSFLQRKWARELNYTLRKNLWTFKENKIAVTFEYEWHNANYQWYRSYGIELWEFNNYGLMTKRTASINDLEISENERKFSLT